MNEKFYAVITIKNRPKIEIPTNCKNTLLDAVDYATKQLNDATTAFCAICEVSEIVERSNPPVSRRPPVERAIDNAGREWPADRSEQSETSTTDRDYIHG